MMLIVVLLASMVIVVILTTTAIVIVATTDTSINKNRGNSSVYHTSFNSYGSTRSNNTMMSINIGNNTPRTIIM